VRVTFDPAYEDGDRVHQGTWHAGPALQRRAERPARHRGSRAGHRPEDHPQRLTSVGYGVHEVTSSPGGHQYLHDDVRLVATGMLHAVTPAWLRVDYRLDTPSARDFLATYVPLP